jgi:hypothetical protein
LVVFHLESSGSKVFFAAYDPDSPDRPIWLTFDRSLRSFRFPSTRYFPGGRVNAYEVFCGGLY